MERKLFFGSHLNGVDGKNRLSIPSDFRDVAQSNCGQRTLLVYEHESLPCLVASDLNFVECLRARRQSEVGSAMVLRARTSRAACSASPSR
ncbi:hypothetical protein [Hankyongella ginsenosidimutans]|uniref:hypothetical protein n=1 Tax=Hankyongella ginsenosidimutans TaxID=1763828 RepID=UPI001CA3852E|nr:hypothetical protein [Hankyongella ginsenosidimutans]